MVFYSLLVLFCLKIADWSDTTLGVSFLLLSANKVFAMKGFAAFTVLAVTSSASSINGTNNVDVRIVLV